jgi:DNA modification methylase
VGWVPILNIIWDKRDPRRAAKDRPSYSYEHILLFAKSPDHFWNREGVLKPFSQSSLKQLQEPYTGQARSDYTNTNQENPSDTKRRIIKAMQQRRGAYLTAVWHIPSGNQPVVTVDGEEVRGIASFPELLAEICIRLGSERGDIVADPYCGMGTTAKMALKLGRQFRGVELNPLYYKATLERTKDLRWKQQILLKQFTPNTPRGRDER